MSADRTRSAQASSIHATLAKIANPTSVTTAQEREKFTSVRQKLMEQKQKGNPIASSILNASQVTTSSNFESNIASKEMQATQSIASTLLSASNISTTTNISNQMQSKQQQINQLSKALNQIAHPESVILPAEKEKVSVIREQLMREKQKGNKVAASILDASEKITGVDVNEQEKEKVENELLNKLLEEEKKRSEDYCSTNFGSSFQSFANIFAIC